MIKEISERIRVFFIENPSFNDVMGNKFIAYLANEKTDFPFATFELKQQNGLSKDVDSYEVDVFFWFDKNKYVEACDFLDKMTLHVKNSDFNWSFSKIEMIVDNQSYVGIINFLI
jgi:hypothetical protein